MSLSAASPDPLTEALATLVEALLPEGGRVLDAGCGRGALALRLAASGHPVVGVDHDLDTLREASEADPRVPFWLSDLTDLDVPQGIIGRGFDVITLVDVASHLPQDRLGEVASTLAGLLAPGGALLTAEPAAGRPALDGACDRAGLTVEPCPVDGPAADSLGDLTLALHHRAEAAPSPAGRLRRLFGR